MKFKQASDVYIVISPTIDSSPLVAIQNAQYVVYGREGVIITKTLGDGVSFQECAVTIHLTDIDTAELPKGKYTHECVIRDTQDNDTFILQDQFEITTTIARIL